MHQKLNNTFYDIINVIVINNDIITNIKACVPYFLSNFYFSSNDSPSKTMKNAFQFI